MTDRFGRSPGDGNVVVSDFDRWVGENNIPRTFEYGKGWWDYVELVRRFADFLDTDDVRVIGHYIVETPPPCERLPMPAVAISKPGVLFALRYDFGRLSMRAGMREWAVSVQRRSPYLGPLFGLIDEAEDLRDEKLDGLGPEFLFGPYREDPARFTCLVRDEWDLATLMRLLAHELVHEL